MQFLAIVRYSHGNRMVHEFRCPLERKAAVEKILKDDPGAKVKLKQKKDLDDAAPKDERQWYPEEHYNPPF